MYKTYIILTVFLLGLYFVCTHKSSNIFEGFSGLDDCPNLLIKKDKRYHLVNTSKARIPGVNPITFDNLEDYSEFLQWQRRMGINCPVLYFQQTYDTQGKASYRHLPNAEQPEIGLPTQVTKLIDAGHSQPPFNYGLYPGFDPMNQYIGDITPLDKMYPSKANPMNPKWKGVQYSEKVVESGAYAGDAITDFKSPSK